MKPVIIFNHIPRTGGTTLRVILNRVYGKERVFFINSRDIPGSLSEYRSFSKEQGVKFKVISGHGAERFMDLIEDPIRITILREPLSLFISQYEYLRRSPDSNFLDDVSKLNSLDEYIDYAVSNGQDNMMVRMLDPLNKQFADHKAEIPNLESEGEELLQRAKLRLNQYDAVFDTDHFDRGIYQLSQILAWKRIPIYRPLNKGNPKRMADYDMSTLLRLKLILKYDIQLYEHYKANIAPASSTSSRKALFLIRQMLIRRIFK